MYAYIYNTQTYKSTIDHDDFLDDSGSITLFVFMKIYIHISGFKFSFILYSTRYKQSMVIMLYKIGSIATKYCDIERFKFQNLTKSYNGRGH